MKRLVLRDYKTDKIIRTRKLNAKCQDKEVYGFYCCGQITIHNAETNGILMKLTVPFSGYKWAIEEFDK